MKDFNFNKTHEKLRINTQNDPDFSLSSIVKFRKTININFDMTLDEMNIQICEYLNTRTRVDVDVELSEKF